MSGTTAHYGLTWLEGGESFQVNGYAFTKADRVLMDLLIYIGVTGHKHNGLSGSGIAAPTSALTLNLSSSGGFLPAGTRIYYKYTYVDANGLESAAGPESFIDTPAPVSPPSPPGIASTNTGGVLLGGLYYYKLTAFAGSNTNESLDGSPNFATISMGTHTNKNTITFPSLPAGASGFNIYRRAPGETRYFYLTSVDMNVATPPTSYVDNGGVGADCDRTLPQTNRTNATNKITAVLPGSTPSVPVGVTWKIYRTIIPSNYNFSLLHWIVEETSEGSGVITPIFVDIGQSTSNGSPPSSSVVLSSPSKIQLTNGEEAQGTLPLGLQDHLVMAPFEFPGTLAILVGNMPYPTIANTLLLGWSIAVGTAPTGSAMVLDINKNGVTVFSDPSLRPSLAASTSWVSTNLAEPILLNTGRLTVDVDTPSSAENMVIVLRLAVKYGSTMSGVYA